MPEDSLKKAGVDIAKGFSSDADKAKASKSNDDEDDDDDSDEDEENQDGTASTDPDKGKPEAKGEKAGDKDEDDDKSDKSKKEPVLTRSEAEKLVNEAVQKAVGAANQTHDRRYNELKKQSDEAEEKRIAEVEAAKLNGLPPEDQARLRATFDLDRERRGLKREREEAAEMHRTARAEQAVNKFGKFGVTLSELQDCDSPEAMDSLCLAKERDYWQKVAEGKITPGADLSQEKTKDKPGSKKPAGATKKTDIGGGGSASKSEAGPAKTLDDFAGGLVESGIIPGRGIERVTK